MQNHHIICTGPAPSGCCGARGSMQRGPLGPDARHTNRREQCARREAWRGAQLGGKEELGESGARDLEEA
eukprot:182148-Rhodomonas_salina.1